MKVNRIRFDKIRMQFDILATAAGIAKYYKDLPDIDYDNYEMDILNEEEREEFKKVHNPIPKISTPKSRLIDQIYGLEKLWQKLLAEEKYEELVECKEIWEALNKELKRL